MATCAMFFKELWAVRFWRVNHASGASGDCEQGQGGKSAKHGRPFGWRGLAMLGDVVAGDIDVDQTAQLADFSDALMLQGGGCSWRVGCSEGR